MNPTLSSWIGSADALMHWRAFRVAQKQIEHAFVEERFADYFVSLVGELFAQLRANAPNKDACSRLANAFAQITSSEMQEVARTHGVSRDDALFYAAAAYYCGDFPASAHLMARLLTPSSLRTEAALACYDFLVRPRELQSRTVPSILAAVRRGDIEAIQGFPSTLSAHATRELQVGPDAWIHSLVLEKLIRQYAAINLRSVLGGDAFWTPLVESFLSRARPTWEFFPSQIEAIRAGLIHETRSFAVQMPTGTGKTALCEILAFAHCRTHWNGVAVMLVPYRSLASELRESLVRRMNEIGIHARCSYGGTIPSGDEVRELRSTQLLVSTPESLSGLLSADEDFFRRISLVICDEGHLIDQPGRGIVLELLLARLKARASGPPRFVFVSAIVPNIEEVGAWLGGPQSGVVRSSYTASRVEFGMLQTIGTGAQTVVNLTLHPQEQEPLRFSLAPFLQRQDFSYRNPKTGREKTYRFSSVRAQAVATARKALEMGGVAIFATNKGGDTGCEGLAKELSNQLSVALDLPDPRNHTKPEAVARVLEYLTLEYGAQWNVALALSAGAVVHHGDLPQETRDALEALLRSESVRFAICTNTLAEGVNLPIRTLVLYSVQRMSADRKRKEMSVREIKNLVGRAGRAGSNTKGLVICANADDWPYVLPVAQNAGGEKVTGALKSLMLRFRVALAINSRPLSNELLEQVILLHSVVDGIDMTLMDLAAEEIGSEALAAMARKLADETFASTQASEESSRDLLRSVFVLRSERVMEIKQSGRLDWVRATGARTRLINSVEHDLLPQTDWTRFSTAMDPQLQTIMLNWAVQNIEVNAAIRDAYKLQAQHSSTNQQQEVVRIATGWLAGWSFVNIASYTGLSVEKLLSIHAKVLSFTLHAIVKEAVALLEKLLLESGIIISPAVPDFVKHLRFGAPTTVAVILADVGIRHRRAYVELGNALQGFATGLDTENTLIPALNSLQSYATEWRARLGALVYETAQESLTGILRN